MDAVHGPDELHAGKVGAVQLGRHGLELRAEEHAQHRGLDHIVKVVAQGDLVAAQFPGLAVQVAPAHPGAQIAGGLFGTVCHLENICFKDGDGDLQQGGVALDLTAVDLVIPRVHYQKAHLKGKVAEPLQQLHQLGHEHGVFPPGDAHGDLVSGPDELIAPDGMGKGPPELLAICFQNALLDALAPGQFTAHLCSSSAPRRTADGIVPVDDRMAPAKSRKPAEKQGISSVSGVQRLFYHGGQQRVNFASPLPPHSTSGR